MSSSEKAKGKRKAADPVKIPFKVTKHEVGRASEGKYVLKLTKPSQPKWNGGLGVKELVSRLCVNAADEHAFNIMFNLNHMNIRWMKALGEFRGVLSALVEPCNGNLYPYFWSKLHDRFNQMPSTLFQNIVRELIEVIDFLRRNGTYHGKLDWSTTLSNESHNVKAFGFQHKDIDQITQAQWEDWIALRKMLQEISNRAREYNESNPLSPLVYGDIDELIDVIAESNIDELPSMKEKVLGNPFFWTKLRRFNIMMNQVPILRRNIDFRRKIINSNICEVPWNCNTKNRPLPESLAKRFDAILDNCNRYRSDLNTMKEYSMPSTSAGPQEKEEEEEEEEEEKEIKPFRTNRKLDLVSLAYATYTHEDKLMEDVDYVFRAKFPKLFSGLHKSAI